MEFSIINSVVLNIKRYKQYNSVKLIITNSVVVNIILTCKTQYNYPSDTH